MNEKSPKPNTQKKPVYKKWWFWVIIVVILLAIFSAGGSSNEATKVGESSDTSTSTEQSTSTNIEDQTFAVGDVISYDNVEITVVSVERNYDTGNQFITPEEGKEYIRVSVKIENKTDDKISYNSYDWEVQDSDGDIQNVALYTQDGALDSGELAAGGKKTGDLFFEVPKDDNGLVLHYEVSFCSDKTIKIKL